MEHLDWKLADDVSPENEEGGPGDWLSDLNSVPLPSQDKGPEACSCEETSSILRKLTFLQTGWASLLIVPCGRWGWVTSTEHRKKCATSKTNILTQNMQHAKHLFSRKAWLVLGTDVAVCTHVSLP